MNPLRAIASSLLLIHTFVISYCSDPYTCDSDSVLPSGLVREIRNYAPVVHQIIDTVVYGAEQNVTYDELAKFVDTFGARPSGSQSLENSIDYMFELLRRRGLDFVHLENVSVVNWQRGHEEAWMVKPRQKKMDILGLGNSVPTQPGGVEAPVLVVQSFEDLEANAKKVRNYVLPKFK
ncbi:hypothetical protein V5799_002332 [Amblyomma americanum]|uniref:Secreted protein n=1 Tax=Amblyomma americanum TaxID=6943 RepID=A0AAQ4CXM1_AMBAM